MKDPIKELPQEIQDKLTVYLERIKKIKWFQPSADLKKADVEKQVGIVLEAFGVKAKISYKQLKTQKDWDAVQSVVRDMAWSAARDAARDAVLDAARDAARDAVLDVVWDAALDAVRSAVRSAVWSAARSAGEIISSDLDSYKKKYPNGSFINLIPLYEMGLYPIGIIDGEFIVAIPASKLEFPKEFQE